MLVKYGFYSCVFYRNISIQITMKKLTGKGWQYRVYDIGNGRVRKINKKINYLLTKNVHNENLLTRALDAKINGIIKIVGENEINELAKLFM